MNDEIIDIGEYLSENQCNKELFSVTLRTSGKNRNGFWFDSSNILPNDYFISNFSVNDLKDYILGYCDKGELCSFTMREDGVIRYGI